MPRQATLLFAALFLIVPSLPAQDSGQSLADFARKEAERKKKEQGSKVVFTGEAATTYIGCYEDRGFTEDRDLHAANYKGDAMTNATCQSYCRDKGFKYAATQNGNECYCGDGYGKYGHVAEAKCDKPCSGNSKEKCGGYWGNAVYQVGGASAGSNSAGAGASESTAGASGTAHPTAGAQGDTASFSVSLSTTQSTVKLGAKVWVSYVITNSSSHKIKVLGLGNDLDYIVEDGTGNKVSYAKHKDRNGRTVMATSGPGGEGILADVDPGKTVKGQIPVSDYYDLSSPGVYTIQASRKDPDSNEVRVSNQITVTVTP